VPPCFGRAVQVDGARERDGEAVAGLLFLVFVGVFGFWF
jgi:hypothetical protein